MTDQADCPSWLPEPVRWYLAHTLAGSSIRSLAREKNQHASTILRNVRRQEQRRDDPIVDSAYHHLEHCLFKANNNEDCETMTAPFKPARLLADEAKLNREAKRILRRLCENGAFLAVAADLEKAAVLKENAQGETTRIAVVTRDVVEAFVLKEWISTKSPGRVATYHVTQAGRAALRRLLAEDDKAKAGFAEAPTPFAEQHRVWGERPVMEPTDDSPRNMRFNLAESPLALLARRKDRDGNPFLTPDLVAAGERLREDFELAQMGTRVTQNWDRFLTGGDKGFGGGGPGMGPAGARDRVAAALRDLGPGLGDVALRCCCYLEGMEAAEKRMGWSARSGKIVLRIALQRLKLHYEGMAGMGGDLIG
ncbi:hypothetical protein ATO10_02665 [Actibacterium atlanticum]|uniref:DUF6456 domain-containing protein n=1 Tax=Actibacterium atlanticum TaxID=1461693 RepID=A0A058ZR34_9RHOB|nr:hypothetical protein ATO10_02665 [Actibacterium atlanticum]